MNIGRKWFDCVARRVLEYRWIEMNEYSPMMNEHMIES